MNFFKTLSEINPGLDVNLQIKMLDGKLAVSVLPQGVSNISPVVLTGTAEEIDEGFMNAITKPLENTHGLKVALKEHEDSLKAAEAEKKKKEKDKPAASKKDKAPKAKSKDLEDEDNDDEEEEANLFTEQ